MSALLICWEIKDFLPCSWEIEDFLPYSWEIEDFSVLLLGN